MDESAFLVDLDQMDDLFVDDPPVVTQPGPVGPPPPVDKALVARLEQLHSTNSCQQLAWSRLGALAAVSPDGRSVKVRVYARDANTDESSLYSIRPATIIHATSPHRITHISWDPSGTALVVVDAIGGTNAYTTIICLNRLENYGHYDCPSEDATGTVAGFDWFEPARSSGFYHTAQRIGDSWKYLLTMTRPRGPFHPMAQKSAGLIVSRNGSLRLIYGQPDYAFGVSRAMLEGVHSAEQMIIHAAMAPDSGMFPMLFKCQMSTNYICADQKALLVTYDAARTLRIYHVSVDWALPQHFVGKPGYPALPVGYRFNPIISSRPLVSVPVELPDLDGGSMQLSHLQVLPEAWVQGTSRPPSPITIMALMTVGAPSAFIMGAQSTERRTRIIRWEVADKSEDLHPAFEQLNGNKTKKPQTSSIEKTKALNRLPDVEVPAVVMSTDFSQAMNQIILTRHDGEIEFRDRNTLGLVMPEPSAAQIHSPKQAGLSFAADRPIIHSALSGNHCMAACRSENEEEITVKLLGHGAPADESQSDDSSKLAALVLAFASSTVQSKNNDDILADLQLLVSSSKITRTQILQALFQSVDLNIDTLDEKFEADQERTNRVLFHASLPRCLSFQQALHTHNGIPDAAARVARIMYNVRASILSIQFSTRSIGVPQEGTTDTPASIRGVMQYLLTLVLFLAGEIIELHRVAPEPSAITQAWVTEQIVQRQSPTLPLLLASGPRFLLRYGCRFLRTMTERARLSQGKVGLAHRQSWAALAELASDCGVGLRSFETLSLELDHHARAAYAAAGLGEKERSEVELRCVVSGEVPAELTPVVQRLVTTSAAKLWAEQSTDPIALHFTDVRMLDLTDDRATRDFHGGDMRLDVIRKTPLSLARAETWRRCSRCCGVMENVPLGKCSQWVMAMQKNCPCGNAWVMDGIDGTMGDEGGAAGGMFG